MDEIIQEVLLVEKACSVEIAQARRLWKERIQTHKDLLARERAMRETGLQEALQRRLQTEREQCGLAAAAEREQVCCLQERLLQDRALCDSIQEQIIDIILQP